MSNRGMIFLAVGMLLLGLMLGGASGGVAGYFMGRNAARPFGGQFNQPFSQNQPPFGPNTQPFDPNNQPFNQNPGNQPFNQNPGQRGFGLGQGAVTGARVVDIQTGSPSESAGLKVNDVITAVAGTRIDSNHSLADLIKVYKPSDKVALSVTRGDQTLSVAVTLGSSPTDNSSAYLGIQYAPVIAQGRSGRQTQ